jgi:hypothetical protein
MDQVSRHIINLPGSVFVDEDAGFGRMHHRVSSDLIQNTRSDENAGDADY